MTVNLCRDEILKKLGTLPEIGIYERRIGYFRVIKSRRGWSIQDFRDDEWYRYSTASETADKLLELEEREKRISESIRENARNIHEQERWEYRRGRR